MLHIILIICLINGMFSSHLFFIVQTFPLWFPFFIPNSTQTILYFSSLILSTITLLLSAIPAALYERHKKRSFSDYNSMLVWLITAVLISYSSYENFGKFLSSLL